MEKEINLQFNQTDIDTIVKGLAELPLKDAVGVFDKIRYQWNKQQNSISESSEAPEQLNG